MTGALRFAPFAAALAALASCENTVVNVPPTDAAPADVAPDVVSADAPADGPTERFSFFVTSLRALQEISGNPNGFGGDLRYGETGPGAGLRGADKLCAAIAERTMPGAGRRPWRAFLSARDGGDGRQVNAIDRVGNGPWYDRLGRLLANNKAELLNVRPPSAHAAIINDFPNEEGVPNHRPDPTMGQVDNHDMLTGSNERGELYAATATCLDWTSARGDTATEGRPRVGHSWPRSGTPVGPMGMGDGGLVPPFMDGGFRPPRDGGFPPMMVDGAMPPPPPPFDGGPGMPVFDGGPGFPPGGMTSGDHWISALDEAGCAPGVSLVEMGGPILSMPTVGSGGGYGGFYCFSLTP